MIFLWLISGIIVVSGTYLLTGGGVDPWSGVHAAEIVAILYVLALVVYLTRPPFPKKTRGYSIVLALVFAGGTIFISHSFERTTRWQQSQLLKILGFIQRGIIVSEIPDPLFKALDRYHRQRPAGKKTMEQIFREVVPDAEVGRKIAQPGEPSNQLAVYVHSMSADEIVLIGQPSWGKGVDPNFRNFDGAFGLPQVRAIMTAKGVSYETEN